MIVKQMQATERGPDLREASAAAAECEGVMCECDVIGSEWGIQLQGGIGLLFRAWD